MNTQAVKSPTQSAVSFKSNARFHLALNVTNLERSVTFYTQLFNQNPTKIRDGYAKWELEEPSLNISLNKAKVVAQAQSGLSHFGIQVKHSSQLEQQRQRFLDKGLLKYEEKQTACCYARQDKFWVEDPDGHQIEFFLVTEADVVENDAQYQTCCN